MANWILLGVPSLEEEFSSIAQTTDVRCKGGKGGGGARGASDCECVLNLLGVFRREGLGYADLSG